jgi:hypothetical protein
VVRTVELTSQQIARRRRYGRLWLITSVVWSLVRTAIVWAALAQYGVHPAVYLLVDLASALVLAWSMPKLVTSLIDKRRRPAIEAGAATLFGYLVPDIYIFMASRHLPVVAIVMLLAVVFVSVAVGVISLRRKVLSGRAARAEAEAAASA